MIVFRPTASAVLVTACALAGPVRAADRTLDELQRALTRLEAEAGAAGPASRDALAAAKTLLGELERRDRAKRMEFGVAGAKALPAKAAERLALARAAYEAGHGRLLRLLHEIAQTPAGTPDEDVRARVKEAASFYQSYRSG